MGLNLVIMSMVTESLIKSGVLSKIIKKTSEGRRDKPQLFLKTKDGEVAIDALSENEIESAISSSEGLETSINVPELPEEELRKLDIEYFEDASNSADEIYQERIRQARQSFNITSVILVIGLITLFFGIIILFLGLMPQGITIAAIGTAFEALGAIMLKLNKDTNDRIDKLSEYVNCMKTAMVALETTKRLSKNYLKDQATIFIIEDIMQKCVPKS